LKVEDLAFLVNEMILSLGDFTAIVASTIEQWKEKNFLKRIWEKDPSIWMQGTVPKYSISELTNRLGWLDAVEKTKPLLKELIDFSGNQRKRGIKDIILLGMGGSSLAPEVIMDVFGSRESRPVLTVLDTTDPETILGLMPMLDPDKTLFIVSSKSGGTIETLSLFKYFYSYYQSIGLEAGDHFVAITDPGSGLERLAKEKRFLKVFSSPPDVGGRYSALTVFGIIPAALIGVDIEKLIERTESLIELCGPDIETEKNPAATLGAFMGEMALKGRDKLSIVISPSISRLGAWIEQLVAESLGKDDKGILPIIDEGALVIEECGSDRAFVYIKLDGDDNTDLESSYKAISSKGIPAAQITVNETYDLGGLFFIWEMATALSASIIGVNPFDQPNVESAKLKSRALMEEYKKTENIKTDRPLFVQDEVEFFGSEAIHGKTIKSGLESFLNGKLDKDYVAIMAYLPYDEELNDCLEDIRAGIRKKTGLAVTLGYGPRFLHSTGQLHKGGGNNGLFIQITHRIIEDMEVPGELYSFGTLITAQALGDYEALMDTGRRVCRLNIRGDIAENLEVILKAL
jgi:glucose-6-phosphate isomerase